MKFLEFWIETARVLLGQAAAGAPQLEQLPDNAARAARLLAGGGLAYAATVEGELEGRFSVLLDRSLAEAPLLGEDVDQRMAWGELIRETVEAAAAELAARTGARCRIARFGPADAEAGTDAGSEAGAAERFRASQAFELRSGDRVWQIAVVDGVRPQADGAGRGEAEAFSSAPAGAGQELPERLASASGPDPASGFAADADPQAGLESGPDSGRGLRPGLELLLDVELEASLRFGSREMPLAEILELGPGDVVQLDRHVADPVDLVVGDKIVARGEVVLVNGNFGLRVTEVAAPRRRLESIRCLF
jgi:flagellar motor switch protein FliN/FliY